MPSAGKQTRRGRGRPPKPLSRKLRDHIARHGTYLGVWPKELTDNSERALRAITICHKVIPEDHLKLLRKLERKAAKHPVREWDFATSVYQAYHLAPFSKDLQVIVDDLVPYYKKELKFLDTNRAVQPWLLRTQGCCLPHTDATWRHENAAPGWTMLLVLRTDEPYIMRFYGHSSPEALSKKGIKPIDFTVDGGQLLMFPASVVHECIAAKGKRRTIMNFIFKVSTVNK